MARRYLRGWCSLSTQIANDEGGLPRVPGGGITGMALCGCGGGMRIAGSPAGGCNVPCWRDSLSLRVLSPGVPAARPPGAICSGGGCGALGGATCGCASCGGAG